MKKLIALVLALALVLSMAACGGSESAADNSQNQIVGNENQSAGASTQSKVSGITSVVHPDFALSENFIEPVTRISQTPEGYVAISTAEDFAKIGLNPTENYILMADIDLSGMEWEGISEFSGILEGNGYTVSNAADAIFMSISGGTVQNLGVRSQMTDGRCGIAWSAVDGATLYNCWFDGSLVTTMAAAGGLVLSVGQADIVSCYNKADITLNIPENATMVDGRAGGIAGEVGKNTVIKNCYNEGNIDIGQSSQIEQNAGGLVGVISINTGDGCMTQIVGSRNSGNVCGKFAAGIVGRVEVTKIYSTLQVMNCFNEGTMDGSEYTAGILNVYYIQKGSILVSDCYNAGGRVQAGIVGGPVLQTQWNAFSQDMMNVLIEKCFNMAPADAGISLLCKNLNECYYLDNSENATEDGALFSSVQKLSATQMTDKSSFEGFDFKTVWQMGQSHPVFCQADY